MKYKGLLILLISSSIIVVFQLPFIFSLFDSINLKNPLTQLDSNQLSVKEINELAKKVTVKVSSANTWGSGILVNRQGSVYTVLTNSHVLLAQKPNYKIQTYDGKIYSALLHKKIDFKDYDLGVVQFQSTQKIYQIATLGSSSTLSEGDHVFAAGFSMKLEEFAYQEFIFTTGEASLLLDKALNLGYQIGSTNDIISGMSGGPLLNHQGQVIGINGIHKYPIWGDPYIFIDGSRPDSDLQKKMIHFSWAIPIDSFREFAPNFFRETQSIATVTI